MDEQRRLVCHRDGTSDADALSRHRDDTGRYAGFKVYRPEATYLAWVDCSALRWDRPAGSVFLDRGGVAFSGGETFCSRHSAFVRLNFATSPQILDHILDRMRDTVRANPPRN